MRNSLRTLTGPRRRQWCSTNVTHHGAVNNTERRGNLLTGLPTSRDTLRIPAPSTTTMHRQSPRCPTITPLCRRRRPCPCLATIVPTTPIHPHMLWMSYRRYSLGRRLRRRRASEPVIEIRTPSIIKIITGNEWLF